MKASLAISEYFHKNKIFETGSRDNCNERFRRLKELLSEQGINLSTEDINPLDSKSEIHIHINADANKLRKSKKSGAYTILVVSESPIICPANQNSKLRKLADKIFTWETNSVESCASWIGCGCSFDDQDTKNGFIEDSKTKDLCMIIGNKSSSQREELYSTRRSAIRYFENSDVSFDLYGTGWNQRSYAGLLRPLNKLKIARSFNHKMPLSYRGTINSKTQALQSYRFALAFENARSMNGYVSEKIFDTLRSGVIPIYIGAENITEFIPDSIYINANQMSFEDIEQTIFSMSKEEYRERLNYIEQYMAEFQKSGFDFNHWAEKIANHVHKIKGIT